MTTATAAIRLPPDSNSVCGSATACALAYGNLDLTYYYVAHDQPAPRGTICCSDIPHTIRPTTCAAGQLSNALRSRQTNTYACKSPSPRRPANPASSPRRRRKSRRCWYCSYDPADPPPAYVHPLPHLANLSASLRPVQQLNQLQRQRRRLSKHGSGALPTATTTTLQLRQRTITYSSFTQIKTAIATTPSATTAQPLTRRATAASWDENGHQENCLRSYQRHRRAHCMPTPPDSFMPPLTATRSALRRKIYNDNSATLGPKPGSDRPRSSTTPALASRPDPHDHQIRFNATAYAAANCCGTYRRYRTDA